MTRIAGWLVLAAAAALGFPACAAPGKVSAKAEAAQPLYVPFDPPLGEPIRYRWEKHESKDGVPRISWHVADYLFEAREGGYRLTVSYVDSGSNESDPDRLAAEKKLAHLVQRPARLLLDEGGAVVEMEEVDAYWEAIFKAIEEVLVERGGAKSPTEEERRRLAEFLKMMRDVPLAVRVGLFTESIQPATEFGETESTLGETIQAEDEAESPFGGPIKRRVSVQLRGVKDGVATYSIYLTVPPEGIAKAAAALIERIGAGEKPEDVARVKAQLAATKFRHETSAVYEVDIATGLTDSFEATETVEASGTGAGKARIIITSLKRID